jgi:hypothetical protein
MKKTHNSIKDIKKEILEIRCRIDAINELNANYLNLIEKGKMEIKRLRAERDELMAYNS